MMLAVGWDLKPELRYSKLEFARISALTHGAEILANAVVCAFRSANSE